MKPPSYISRREYLPGNLEISYKEFKEELEDRNWSDEFNLTEEHYSNSKLFIDAEYLGRHEDNTTGEVTFRVYPEESQEVETVRINGVDRRLVQEILNGREVVEDKIGEELTPEYGNETQVATGATD